MDKRQRNLKKRLAREGRFRLYGILSLSLSALFLVFFLGSLLHDGLPAFLRHEVFAPRDPSSIHLLSRKQDHPSPEPTWRLASSEVEMYLKDKLHRLSKDEQKQVDTWVQEGHVRPIFNLGFLTHKDSREPEWAGLWGALWGSLFSVFVCFLCAVPLGVGAAIYLEEFAPKSRLIHLIEVNISNMAAIPSILFGLLGLTLFIQILGLPRPSSLVGGLTLALMVLPLIIVATRTGLQNVPKTFKEAALALGATPMYVMGRHSLPLALPTILTGIILSLARALGETAPLLLIGMVAFIADPPHNLTDPATALPVQIYAWSRSAEQGFVENTAGAILVLLLILAIMNVGASFLRKTLEQRF